MEGVEFSLERCLVLARHAVDEEDAMEMIVFVLNGTGEEAAAAELDGLSVLVGGADLGGFGAGDIGVDIGEAEAAFGAVDGGAEGFDVGVDEDHGHVWVGVDRLAIDFEGGGAILDVTDIEDGELEGMADLLSGEADAGSGVHGFEHMGDEFPDFGSELADFGAFAAEDRGTVVNDGQLHR